MPTGLPTAVFLDMNGIVSAFRSPKKSVGTVRLILTLLDRKEVELVGNPILLHEYARHAEELASPTAARLLTAILERIRTVDPDERHVRACAPYYLEGQEADCVHAAT